MCMGVKKKGGGGGGGAEERGRETERQRDKESDQ